MLYTLLLGRLFICLCVCVCVGVSECGFIYWFILYIIYILVWWVYIHLLFMYC